MPRVVVNVPRPPRATLELEFGEPKVDHLITAYTARYKRYTAELEHERELVAELEQAIALDSEDFAAKLNSGDETEPARKRTLAAEEKLAACRRRSVALARRLNKDFGPIVRAIQRHEQQIRERARQREREAAARLIDGLLELNLDELHVARQVVSQCEWWRGELGPMAVEESLWQFDPVGALECRTPGQPMTIESLLETIAAALASRVAEDVEPGPGVLVEGSELEALQQTG